MNDTTPDTKTIENTQMKSMKDNNYVKPSCTDNPKAVHICFKMTCSSEQGIFHLRHISPTVFTCGSCIE